MCCLKDRQEINTVSAVSKTVPQSTYSYCPDMCSGCILLVPHVPPSELSPDFSYGGCGSVMVGQRLGG